MLDSPFTFEERLSPEDYQKIGLLALRRSQIEHIIGNCLRVALRVTDAEAIPIIFSLTVDRRLKNLADLDKIKPFNPEAKEAFSELSAVMKGIQAVRNTAVHAVIDAEDDFRETRFHLRSRGRSITKEDVFATEEITNYAAHAALSLRFALGLKGPRRANGMHCPIDPRYQRHFWGLSPLVREQISSFHPGRSHLIRDLDSRSQPRPWIGIQRMLPLTLLSPFVVGLFFGCSQSPR